MTLLRPSIQAMINKDVSHLSMRLRSILPVANITSEKNIRQKIQEGKFFHRGLVEFIRIEYLIFQEKKRKKKNQRLAFLPLVSDQLCQVSLVVAMIKINSNDR
jgi:hypothetical protein